MSIEQDRVMFFTLIAMRNYFSIIRHSTLLFIYQRVITLIPQSARHLCYAVDYNAIYEVVFTRDLNLRGQSRQCCMR